MMIKNIKIDLNEQIATNFKLGEAIYLPSWQIYAVPDEMIYRNILRMAAKLQLVRDHFSRPINIHCWWRPREYNKFIGSKCVNSPHLTALAIDFDVDGLDCVEVQLELEKHLEEYDLYMEDGTQTWVHIDLLERPKRIFTA